MGAWIEIWIQPDFFSGSTVAPLVGAWIEIPMHQAHLASGFPSLPLWERGLKFSFLLGVEMSVRVAPLVGAWIEIISIKAEIFYSMVAPLVGAWIEIFPYSLHSPEFIVAPLVGAWIEIGLFIPFAHPLPSRSPCGSVD